MNGIIISYGNYYFIIPQNIRCSVNNLNVECKILDNNTIFLPFNNNKNENTVLIRL